MKFRLDCEMDPSWAINFLEFVKSMEYEDNKENTFCGEGTFRPKFTVNDMPLDEFLEKTKNENKTARCIICQNEIKDSKWGIPSIGYPICSKCALTRLQEILDTEGQKILKEDPERYKEIIESIEKIKKSLNE